MARRQGARRGARLREVAVPPSRPGTRRARPDLGSALTTARVVVERSLTKSLLALGGCVLLVALCLLLATTGHPVAVTIAVVGAATFTTFGALWVRQLARGGPALVVDEDGFDDRSSATAVGRVPWSDVTHVTAWQASGSSCVVVRVRNPDEHLARLGWFARRAARANVAMLGTPVVLASQGMQLDADGLLELLRAGFERYSGSLGVFPPAR